MQVQGPAEQQGRSEWNCFVSASVVHTPALQKLTALVDRCSTSSLLSASLPAASCYGEHPDEEDRCRAEALARLSENTDPDLAVELCRGRLVVGYRQSLTFLGYHSPYRNPKVNL